MPNGSQSVDFFRQLAVFSGRYIQASLLRASLPSIRGAVIHYTADEDLDRVIRWFNDASLNAQASAHVIIADHKVPNHDALAIDLPLVKALPATVIQCRPPTQGAWHATWCNSGYYGIECISAGELKTKDDGQTFQTWRPVKAGGPDWTDAWGRPDKTAAKAWARWWDPFTSPQSAAVVAVLRYLRDLPGAALARPHVVGHENVQGVATIKHDGQPMRTDKRDPGPTCPIHGIRAAAFDDWRPMEQYEWWRAGDAVRGAEHTVQQVVAALAGMLDLPAPEQAWARLATGLGEGALPWVKLGLWLLGYYMPSVTGPGLGGQIDTDEAQSVWLFQRMSGLTTDGLLGPETRKALVARLKDRGIL
jgi:N-acetyl-anhydromuramyl-L-alanine amidase AmpD